MGWVVADGTNFWNLSEARDFLKIHSVSDLPDGSAMLDSFIARVSADGTIQESFSYYTESEA